jgi:Phosphopantetheine attachment site
MAVPDDLLNRVLECANRAAGKSFSLPPGGDLPLEAFEFDSLSLFAFLLELERKCGMKFDETIINLDGFRTIRSAAALVQDGGLAGAQK